MNSLIPVSFRLASAAKPLAFAMLALLLAVLCQQSASAQYLASTKAGFVNRVEGKVMIQRAGHEFNEAGRASLGTQMKDGDQLITTASSRAELLLSPGSWLRLDGSTRVRAISTRFSGMRFEILSGSAIAEVSAEENATIKRENPLEIVTPHGSMNIARTGVYRFDVKDGYTNATAYNGELYLGTREQLLAKTAPKVGRGKFAHLTGSNAAAPEIAKVDADVTDGFFDWSFQRAETLVAAHRSVLSRSSSLTSLSSGWIFDPFYNCYTYIPFNRRFYTGYGFGFYSSFSACNCNGWGGYWYPYYGSGPYNSAGTGYGSSVTPTVTPRTRGDSDRSATVVHPVSVGRRVDVAPPSINSPGMSSRGVDTFGASVPTRSMGGSNVGSFGDRSVGAPSVSPGRIESNTGRSVGESGGSARGAGGRVVNP
ncbi:MAG: FecR domain-containing protein [Blastocatellia bacterium]